MTDDNESIWSVTTPQKPLSRTVADVEYISIENSGRDVSNNRAFRNYHDDLDAIVNLYESYLEVDYTVTKDGSTAPTDTNNEDIALVANGWYLFENVQIRLGKNEMHSIDKPGRISHMKMLLEDEVDFIDTVGPNQQYYLDTVADAGVAVTTATRAAKLGGNAAYVKRRTGAAAGQQKAILPLRDVFGVATLQRVIRGTPIEFRGTLIRNATEALYGQVNTTAAVKINRLQLWLATYKPKDEMVKQLRGATGSVDHYVKNMMLHTKNVSAGAAYHTHQFVHKQQRPTKCAIAFGLSSRNTSYGLNTLQYDLCDGGANVLTRLELKHNGRSIPHVVYDPTLDKSGRILEDIRRTMMVDEEASLAVNKDNWETLFPIFLFDLSALEGEARESVNQSTLTVNWDVTANAEAHTLYAFLESETKITVKFDGGDQQFYATL